MRKILTISFYLAGAVVLAQESVFTLNQFTPLSLNPASPTTDHEATFNAFHEEYTLASSDYISTNIFNAEYPFMEKSTGRRYLGLGLSFMQKDFGRSDLLKTNNAGLAIASSVQLTMQQTLSLGVSGNYYNRRTSMESLSTGSQWIEEEFRFDPNADLGETFSSRNISYLSLGTGIIWQLMEADQQKAFVGVSAFHLNRPRESFFEEGVEVPVTYVANAGSVLYHSQRVVFTPQVFYSRSNRLNTYRTILSTRLLFANNNPYDMIRSGNVDLLVDYAFKRDASLGIVLNQPGFSFGFAYHFPIGNSTREVYLQNGIQVGLRISRLLWKKEPQKVVVQAVPQQRQISFGNQTPVVRQDSEIDQVRNKLEELDEVKALQFQLNKDFRFEFGEAELTGDSGPFLKEMADMLKENPDFRLRIIGHTDNVGRQQVNYELSLRRAQVVADQLTAMGVTAENIEVIGKGDTEPVAPNDTDENKAKNRRVEFIISVNR